MMLSHSPVAFLGSFRRGRVGDCEISHELATRGKDWALQCPEAPIQLNRSLNSFLQENYVGSPSTFVLHRAFNVHEEVSTQSFG